MKLMIPNPRRRKRPRGISRDDEQDFFDHVGTVDLYQSALEYIHLIAADERVGVELKILGLQDLRNKCDELSQILAEEAAS
jgi:hypothetical protein